LKDAKHDRYDILLVYRVDRLARSIRGLVQIIDELDQAGVIFRSPTEPFDTGTPAGRMMVQMLGVLRLHSCAASARPSALSGLPQSSQSEARHFRGFSSMFAAVRGSLKEIGAIGDSSLRR
jgi:Resolvase, N terminal domain